MTRFNRMSRKSRIAARLAMLMAAMPLPAVAAALPWAAATAPTFYVAPAGNDHNPGTLASPFRTIQHAVASATPGTTILVRAGVYHEQVNINRSGSAAAGYITVQNYVGEKPVVDGTGLKLPAGGSAGLFTLTDVSYVKLMGFEIRNYTTNSANAVPAGILVHGAGDHLLIANNYVHHIKTTVNNSDGNAFGIAVYGTRAPASINALTIDGNEVAYLTTGSSESLTLNGNVQNFIVSNNRVHDNNNIGIDMIGYEGTAPNAAYDRARDGLVTGNSVYNISAYGNPAYGNSYGADGIYVDGGTRITIERNTVSKADIGIEVASEHKGRVSDFVTVRSNLITSSNVVGISIGGYSSGVGGTDSCTIVNNTLFGNDTQQSGTGEFTVQFHATRNQFKNNIVFANDQGLLFSEATRYTTAPVVMDGNLYDSTADASSLSWAWNGTSYGSLADFVTGTGNDHQSVYADPRFVNATVGKFQTMKDSPAVDHGLNLGSAVIGTTDLAGNPRVQGKAVDIGAYEQ
ncbi:MAG: right-handed parallel beta-helix repeat-containing protein [Burkholderiales bacterium]|nr:right-handed parallel beta-helix repeat-containing protein [Burkholderiales bacterium]